MVNIEHYLIIEFDWPETITKELATSVRKFHDLIELEDWINEEIAASGGIGGEFSSIWIFNIGPYAGLDKFFHGDNPIAEHFPKWADFMAKMRISVKQKVHFV